MRRAITLLLAFLGAAAAPAAAAAARVNYEPLGLAGPLSPATLPLPAGLPNHPVPVPALPGRPLIELPVFPLLPASPIPATLPATLPGPALPGPAPLRPTFSAPKPDLETGLRVLGAFFDGRK